MITIGSADGRTSATFIPNANLVCSTLMHDAADWLDPVRAEQARAVGKDYGISLVCPWAGPLERSGYSAAGHDVELAPDDERIPREKTGLPIHGVWDRLLQWEVENGSEHRLTAHLSWEEARLLEVFPFPHQLRVTASVDTGRLSMRTELRPTGDLGVPVAFGYHAFLRIPNSDRGTWTMELPGREVPVPAMAEHDDIGLDVPARVAFRDRQSVVSMDLEAGFAVAHLFAPPMQDLVSLEPMTAPAGALNSGDGLTIVGPGDTFLSSFTISLER